MSLSQLLRSARAGFRRAMTAGSIIATTLAITPGMAQASPSSDHVNQRQVQFAPYGGCGVSRKASIRGGSASWTTTCKDGKISVYGIVYGRGGRGIAPCVTVKAHFVGGTWEGTRAVCGSGDHASFGWSHPGDIVDVYLQRA